MRLCLLLTVVAALLALTLSAHADSETLTVEMAVSPSNVYLNSQGVWVTVHAEIPYSEVTGVSVTLDGIPQNVGVQSEVRMGDDIPQTRDLSPGHVRVALAQVARELLDRFTNDVEVQQHGVRPDIVLENLVLRAALGVPDDLLAALLDVFEEQ